MYDSAARAPRGGRERRVGLRKPVVVRCDRRPADRHSGGLLAGPIGFPKAHPSLPPGERAVRVRTETLPTFRQDFPAGLRPVGGHALLARRRSCDPPPARPSTFASIAVADAPPWPPTSLTAGPRRPS